MTDINMTPRAIAKVKEILAAKPHPKPAGIRLGIIGGGCSGFSYQMALEEQSNPSEFDKVFDFDGIKIFVDQASMLYLDGTTVDYVERLEGSGFKFENPNVKSTCGCGSSFSV